MWAATTAPSPSTDARSRRRGPCRSRADPSHRPPAARAGRGTERRPRGQRLEPLPRAEMHHDRSRPRPLRRRQGGARVGAARQPRGRRHLPTAPRPWTRRHDPHPHGVPCRATVAGQAAPRGGTAARPHRAGAPRSRATRQSPALERGDARGPRHGARPRPNRPRPRRAGAGPVFPNADRPCGGRDGA